MVDVSKHKKPRVRSPAYPAIDLKTAIEKARIIYDHEKRNAAPVGVVAKHCGLDIGSSGGQRLIAALKQFGLVNEQGEGEDRQVRLSDPALDILLADSEHSLPLHAAIKQAALSPKIHRLLWKHYKGELPSDQSMRAYLVRHLEFNDAHVDRFIKEFRDTIQFANLSPEDTIPGSAADENELDPGEIMSTQKTDLRSSFGREFPKSGMPPQGNSVVVSGPSSGTTLRDLPVTLPSLEIAILRLPVPMSETDFKTLVNSLTSMKDSLVKPVEEKKK